MTGQRPSSTNRHAAPHLASFDALLIDAGIQPKQFFRILKKDLAGTPDPLRAVNNLHRFLSAGFATSILRDFLRHPVLQTIALEIFAQSQYLADILVRDPELFRWLTATAVLKSEKSRETFRDEARAAVEPFSRADRKLDALKRFHRREILRIGCRDVLQEADVVVVTRELSGLADSIIGAVLEIGWHDLQARTGVSFENTLSVIGLGKLGGGELNFSSDIDLLFLYEADGEFEGGYERIRTFHEFYNRLAEFVVRKLTEFTDEGSLYRVDMRLRPEGRSGPLALSIPASIGYYEARGETWERQMLVKARLSAGNARTADRWLEAIRPFVYPRTFLRNPLEELSDMKARIEARIDSEGNVKLGEGGIRDVEFIAQGLQLLNGGVDERLRERNSLLALAELGRARKLRKPDVTALSEAYKFLRTVEHRLQLLHGTQTHMLPEDESETALLARRLGFRSSRAFTRVLRSHRRAVRAVFQAVLRPRVRRRPTTGGGRDTAPKFIDPPTGKKHVQTILDALQGSGEERRDVHAILAGTRAPDWCAESLAIIAESPHVRRAFAQAWKNRELAELLATVGTKSRATIALMVREPVLFETLVGLPEEWFSEEWGWRFLREHDLQRFHAFNEQKTVVRFLAGSLALPDMVRKLSDLADELLLAAAGATPGFPDGALMALGKLGGREITVRSDLDLVYVYDIRRQKPAEAEQIVKDFTAFCRAHGVHETDFQLRPEGKNAPMAVDIDYYRTYLRERAALWERQAHVKARIVFGAPDLAATLHELHMEFLFERPLAGGWKSEIRAMKERVEAERSPGGLSGRNFKTAAGGLMDLEFAVQALQLEHGREVPDLRARGTLDALRSCMEMGILGRREGEAAVRNLLTLRSLETFIKLNSERVDLVLPEDPRRLQALASAMGLSTSTALVRLLERTASSNRAFFDKILQD